MEKKNKILLSSIGGLLILSTGALLSLGYMQSIKIEKEINNFININSKKMPKNISLKAKINKGIFSTEGKLFLNNSLQTNDFKAGDSITDFSINHNPKQFFTKEYKIKAITLNHFFKNAKTSSQYFATYDLNLKQTGIDGNINFSSITFKNQNENVISSNKINDYIANVSYDKKSGDIDLKFNFPKIISEESIADSNIKNTATLLNTKFDLKLNEKNQSVYNFFINVEEFTEKNLTMENLKIISSFSLNKEKYDFINKISIDNIKGPMINDVSTKFAFSIKDLDKKTVDDFNKKYQEFANSKDNEKNINDFIKNLSLKGLRASIDNIEFSSPKGSFSANVNLELTKSEQLSLEDNLSASIGFKTNGEFYNLFKVFSQGFSNEPGLLKSDNDILLVYKDKQFTINSEPSINQSMNFTIRTMLRNFDKHLGVDISNRESLDIFDNSSIINEQEEILNQTPEEKQILENNFKKMNFKDNVSYDKFFIHI